MIIFPNCKINLGLSVRDKRKDGYHNLETVFYPVKLHDVLEIISEGSADNPAAGHESPLLTITGFDVVGNANDNLCVKAYHLLKTDFPKLPRTRMHLHKAIPMGAGLGGGSADAAFTLRLLNEKFQLKLTNDKLIDYALRLGSDCPFFILNKPCFASGRGELMEEINLDLSAYKIVLVNCGIHVNTGAAFARLARGENTDDVAPSGKLKTIMQQPVETWKDVLYNDFETPVFKQFPVISQVKQQLYESGALYAAMTGSGSTVFGIFQNDRISLPEFPKEYMVIGV
ncbi:MAG TPA: 4-(cytidine 5'-diphospho)-2-C-methyl-D-erythritol kinase [Chitinophagaceae bacterium]|nr:4-(cytidine 5'-diphospho)-2-C-methyl-D-erythritol kinase [Chitinophagaceae bacterium]